MAGGLTGTPAEAGAVTASKDELEELQNETGEDAAKNALKLPDKIATPGAPPPIDKSKPPGGGEGGGVVDRVSSDLERRRDRLAQQLVDLQWDLGGIAYEMAIRDHFRLDVLNSQAAKLQQVDAELAEVERMLKLGQAGAAGACCRLRRPLRAGRGVLLAVRPRPDGQPCCRHGGWSGMKGYRRLLYWVALPVRDRRWAAPLSALALGLGLFVGIAIGPGAAGTLATGGVKIVELPGFGDGGEEPVAAVGGEASHPAKASKPVPAPEPSGSSSFGSAGFTPLPFEEPLATEPAPSGGEQEAEPEAPAAEEEPEAEEEILAGTVVHVNMAAGSYVVAEADGALSAVHAPTAPRTGTEVEVPIDPLTNGTYAEVGKRQRVATEAKTSVTVSGTVTFVSADPLAPVYVVSARGASILVHVHPEPEGTETALPPVGSLAKVAVELEEKLVWQRHLEAEGEPAEFAEFAGIVKRVDLEAHQLVLSADDVDEGGQELLFQLPEGELTPPEIGSSVLAAATIAEDKTLLSELTSDEHRKGAEAEPLLHLFHTSTQARNKLPRWPLRGWRQRRAVH